MEGASGSGGWNLPPSDDPSSGLGPVPGGFDDVPDLVVKGEPDPAAHVYGERGPHGYAGSMLPLSGGRGGSHFWYEPEFPAHISRWHDAGDPYRGAGLSFEAGHGHGGDDPLREAAPGFASYFDPLQQHVDPLMYPGPSPYSYQRSAEPGPPSDMPSSLLARQQQDLYAQQRAQHLHHHQQHHHPQHHGHPYGGESGPMGLAGVVQRGQLGSQKTSGSGRGGGGSGAGSVGGGPGGPTGAARGNNVVHGSHGGAVQKQRLRWTPDLHANFVSAVVTLGGPKKATPKAILKEMQVPGMTVYHVKSHLQKFRMHTREKTKASNKSAGAGANGAGGKKLAASGGAGMDVPSNAQTSGGNAEGSPGQDGLLSLSSSPEMQGHLMMRLQEQLKLQQKLQHSIEEHGKYLNHLLSEQEKQQVAVKQEEEQHAKSGTAAGTGDLVVKKEEGSDEEKKS